MVCPNKWTHHLSFSYPTENSPNTHKHNVYGSPIIALKFLNTSYLLYDHADSAGT